MLELFTIVANKVGVNVSMLLAICTVESRLKNVNNFDDPRGGSHGVCQINGKTAKMLVPHLDILALQQPSVNVKVAALYLKQLQKRYIFDELTIAAYNTGSPKYRGDELINQAYVDKVEAIRNTYDTN